MRTKDITNKTFGRLTVVSFDSYKGVGGHAYWLCVCTCGMTKVVRGSHLRSKQSKSCGCLAKEVAKKLLTKYATSKAHKGKGNPQWKGKEASVSSIHTWLGKHYKKTKCKHCGSTKKLDWALIKGFTYDHIRKHFMPLCRGCHLKYDYTDIRKQKISNTLNKKLTKI